MMIIDPVAFQIGKISVYWYGIIIASAVIIGLILILRESKKQGIDTEFFLDFIIIAIPVSIISARIYYVIFRWDMYKMNIYRIFAIWEGGLAIHGAIIGGFLTLIYMTGKRKIALTRALDILTPSVVLGQAIGRWGNFVNQEAYGGIVSKDFINHFPQFIKEQMYINGNYYHPAFLYESLWDLSIFIILIISRRKKFIITGDLFFIYAILYSVGRYIIEGIRTDSLMIGEYRVAQLISILIIIICGGIIFWRHYIRPTDKEGS